jgi:hypothetical protein
MSTKTIIVMRKLITTTFLLCASMVIVAQECDLPLSIAFAKDSEHIPTSVQRSLANKLKQVLTQNGVSGDFYYEQFALVPKFEVVDKHVVPGPPPKYVYNLTLYLEIRNTTENNVFAMSSLEINTVGENETKAYMGAVRQIAPQSSQIKSLISMGRKKIQTYYDKNYQRIIQKAQQLSGMNKNEEALYHIMSIPECCSGYQVAMKEAQAIFQKYTDRNGEQLLMQAKAIWAAGNNEKAAREAAYLLTQIDPSSKAYKEAGALLNEIKEKSSANAPWNFKLKVYNDAVSLEQQRIEAAKAVGVAFGEGQPDYMSSDLIFVR